MNLDVAAMASTAPQSAKDRFVKRFRERLKAAGLSQRELSERVGVSKNTVSAWATGASLPTALHIVAIADALSVSVEELVEGRDAPETTAAGHRLLRRLAALDLREAIVPLDRASRELESIVAAVEGELARPEDRVEG